MTGFVMTGLAPLIADIGDVIGVLVFIVIGLLSLIGQIMNKGKEGQQKAGPPPGQRPRPQPQPRQQQGPLANEIDQFVKQAAQRRAEGRPQPAAQRQNVRPARAQPPVEAVSVQLLQPLDEGIRTNAATERIGEPGSRRLERDVAQADENLKKHVPGVSNHRVGQLSGAPSENAGESGVIVPPAAAAGMAAMLSDPANIRQAIVLTEILQRPEHRWG